MTTPDLHHLAAAYALDALDADERAAFERHLPSCNVCSADVHAHRETAAELGSLIATPPPAALRDSLLAEIAQTRQLSPLDPPPGRSGSSGHPGAPVTDLSAERTRRRTVVTGAIAAAAALALFVAGMIVARSSERTTFDERAATVLAAPDVRFVDLAGSADGSGSSRFRVAFTDSEVVVFGDELDAARDGLAYELWALDAAGGATPLRLLDDAESGSVREVVSLDVEPTAFGVTIEDERGADSPTEPILFLGNVTN